MISLCVGLQIKSCFFLNKWLVVMRLGGKSTTTALQKKNSPEDYRILKEFKFVGFFTLSFKITRKVTQYIIPRICKIKNPY
jgi:hypothetical protein